VVVELLEGVVDVNGRALVGDKPAKGVAARLTFRAPLARDSIG